MPGPRGAEIPLPGLSVERESGWWLVEHPPPRPEGLSPGGDDDGPEHLRLPPPSLLGGTRDRTRLWCHRGGRGEMGPVVYLKLILPSSPLPGAAL